MSTYRAMLSVKTGVALRVSGLSVLVLALSACGGGMTVDNKTQAAVATEDRATALSADPTAKYPDHHEFDAALDVPFSVADASGARTFTVRLDYVGAPAGTLLAYRVELRGAGGSVVKRWSGVERYAGDVKTVALDWAGRGDSGLSDGVYTATLTAVSAAAGTELKTASTEAQFDEIAQAGGGHGPVTQSWNFAIGKPAKITMGSLRPLATHAVGEAEQRVRAQSAAVGTGSWPYTIYYGSFHGQTNDSDGGGAIGSCSSSQPAQTGAYGPDAAFPYAKNVGLDFFANTDHNHYFDGSSSTNTAGSATAAKARYQRGLTIAADVTAANPGFLALYGMEWGVINNGGHLNIFNSNELFSWEYNASNELFGDRYTAKSDYATLYSVMRAQGLIGQFNHPDDSGQFIINGTDMAYSADGDEVMVLSEVMNTSAFSSNTTETETSRSSYEGAWKKLLERGFHVAPATNQDNHCANWGASYTNRTAVLIPTGTALSKASLVDALKARRVFATMDKQSQLIFSANGKIMGERFDNSGALSMNVGFYSPAGRTVVSTEIWEGVPGRNGTVTLTTTSPTATITPSNGKHFYYAKVTQDDGKVLWSAPIWVNQGVAGGDTTPPTVSATVSGSTGTITFTAAAADNVGVTRVEFWLDGVLKDTVSTAPYTLAVNSTLLANGSHTLAAKAFDAAGNATTSTPVSFTVSNPVNAGDEVEPNNTVATANAVGSRTAIAGYLSTATDKDYFKVALAANQRLRVDMTGPTASGVDYDLYVVSSTGAGLARSEGATSSESLTYQNGATATTVYIKVQAYSGSSTTQSYRLSISYP
ncbi:CehA/McbA family metallohydrolase [Roseateles amylovorans]|uniref:CehA/McbA family metallohydrolase n=1 Tax=Roseateles amylovorans TaxID=2978473 RepID=A0ABY6AWL3_9BURK|nr:CehA/McbA family metallohydrolase [Roseateles amylovorans]UXH77367.1 CehA/McbA family metallohydrolase [Roseateles amylovorans]